MNCAIDNAIKLLLHSLQFNFYIYIRLHETGREGKNLYFYYIRDRDIVMNFFIMH